MTLLEAVKANPVMVNVPENTIIVAFVGRDIEHTDDYSSSYKESVELVSADLYAAIAASPSFSEGDLSVTHDPKVLMNRARNIYLKYGDDKASEMALSPLPLTITKE